MTQYRRLPDCPDLPDNSKDSFFHARVFPSRGTLAHSGLPSSSQHQSSPVARQSSKRLELVSSGQVTQAWHKVNCDRYLVQKCFETKPISSSSFNLCTISDRFRQTFYPACKFRPSGPFYHPAEVENCIFPFVLSIDIIVLKLTTSIPCLAVPLLVKKTEHSKILLLVRQFLFPEMTFMVILPSGLVVVNSPLSTTEEQARESWKVGRLTIQSLLYSIAFLPADLSKQYHTHLLETLPLSPTVQVFKPAIICNNVLILFVFRLAVE